MVESVAKAIYESWANYPACSESDPWEIEAEKMPGKAEHFRKHARAAIEAMREPTLRMESAALPHVMRQHQTRDVWRAMIDAALSEPLADDHRD